MIDVWGWAGRGVGGQSISWLLRALRRAVSLLSNARRIVIIVGPHQTVPHTGYPETNIATDNNKRS